MIEDKRYIVCRNEAEAENDRKDRERIVAALDTQLKKGDKALIGNSAYRRYLRKTDERKNTPTFEIDLGKLAEEARFDGIFVLRTNAKITPLQAVLRYRDLLKVENLFLRTKAVMRTRPIFHSSDAAIRGHVFCSFLALSCRNTWKTCHARPASSRNGRPFCAISIACSMCASAIAAMTGWFAPTSPSRSPIYSTTLTSRCRRAPGRWRRRNLSHPKHPPGNAAVAPGVVPRRHEFRRKQRDLNRLQKSSVQVG